MNITKPIIKGINKFLHDFLMFSSVISVWVNELRLVWVRFLQSKIVKSLDQWTMQVVRNSFYYKSDIKILSNNLPLFGIK